MEYFIKIIGAALARAIENGSRRGAIAGAASALALALFIAFALSRIEDLGAFRYAIYIILAVPFSVAGALIGSRVGPRQPPPDARLAFRITNYNHAGAKLLIAVVFAGLSITFLLQKGNSKAPDGDAAAIWGALSFALVSLICVCIASRDIWYIEIGGRLKIRRLFRSREYNLSNLRQWGFEIQRGKLSKEMFNGNSELHFQFDDGSAVRIPVRGEYSKAILQSLGASAVASRYDLISQKSVRRVSPVEVPMPILPSRPIASGEIAAAIREGRE